MRDKILPRSRGFCEDSVTVFSHSHSSRLCEEASAHPPLPPFSPPALTPFLFLTFSLPDWSSSQQGVIIYKQAATQERWREVGLAATSCQSLPPVFMFAILAGATTVHYHLSFLQQLPQRKWLWIYSAAVNTSKSKANQNELFSFLAPP